MVDEKALKNLAQLARISVTDTELTTLGTELDGILSFINEIDSIEVSQKNGILGTDHTVFREDIVLSLVPAHDLVEVAPQQQDHFIKVPKVIGE